jgi:hypothetical protein
MHVEAASAIKAMAMVSYGHKWLSKQAEFLVSLSVKFQN